MRAVARRPISTEGAKKVGMKRKISDMQFDTDDKDRLKKKVRVGLPAQQWITIYNAHRPDEAKVPLQRGELAHRAARGER